MPGTETKSFILSLVCPSKRVVDVSFFAFLKTAGLGLGCFTPAVLG